MTNEPLTYVIDDDPEISRSIALLLAVDGLRARCFSSAEAFVEALPQLKPGVIVSDVAMGNMSGLDLVEFLGREERRDPVIVITGHGDVPLAVRALKAGARDFIEKPFDATILLAAVHAAHDLVMNAQNAGDGLASLSHRERQVLGFIVDGLTSKEIAIRLHISPRTVDTYRHNLMVKTGATSMSQLIRIAIEGARRQASKAKSVLGSRMVSE